MPHGGKAGAMFRLLVAKKLGLVALVALILVSGTLFAQQDGDCNCCTGGNGLGCNCQACEDIVCTNADQSLETTDGIHHFSDAMHSSVQIGSPRPTRSPTLDTPCPGGVSGWF